MHQVKLAHKYLVGCRAVPISSRTSGVMSFAEQLSESNAASRPACVARSSLTGPGYLHILAGSEIAKLKSDKLMSTKCFYAVIAKLLQTGRRPRMGQKIHIPEALAMSP
jgi:hypothetical protein